MQGHTIAKNATVIYCHIRIDETMLANLYSVTNNGMGINLATVTDDSVVANDSKSSNINILAYSSLGRNTCQWVDTALPGLGSLVYLKKFCYALVSVVYTNKGCW